MALEIRKKAVKNFEHIYNSYKLTFSDLRIAFNGETQNVLITRENGAFVIKREGFNVTEISVYDETGAGTEETFVNVTVLANRLIELGYIAFYEDGDIVPSEFISSDASNSLTIGTDGLLFVPPAGAATNGLPVGGTTGQILKKQSATDFDADWEDETGGAVQSVTGDSVDNTDPNNPVVNAIPLSGTEVGSPVTGDIEFEGDGADLSLFFYDENGYRKSIFLNTSGFGFFNWIDYLADPLNSTYIIIDPVTKGIYSDTYYGANYDDNTYVQKKYVDDNLQIPTENQIEFKIQEATVSGTFELDLATYSDFYLTMTADTELSFKAGTLPALGFGKRFKMVLTGDFPQTWADAYMNSFGDDYDGTKLNDVLCEVAHLAAGYRGEAINQQRETA